jgi:hypothetical protein
VFRFLLNLLESRANPTPTAGYAPRARLALERMADRCMPGGLPLGCEALDLSLSLAPPSDQAAQTRPLIQVEMPSPAPHAPVPPAM